MVRKQKNTEQQTPGSSYNSKYSNIRTFHYNDFKLFWVSKLLLIEKFALKYSGFGFTKLLPNITSWTLNY